MAKDKERTINPAQAQRKAEKLKALKKSKAEQQARRNEKLARRNPARIERQINDLKAAEESGQQLKPHEKQRLEELERDLKAVQKAREALGDAAPKFTSFKSDRDHSTLGKRQRDGHGRPRRHDDSSETDEDVMNIPMPRDKSPPIPREYWQRKRERREKEAANHPDKGLPPKPVVESKAVYEAAPEIRDLRKEAVSRFVPATVRQKQQNITGPGRLLEPEEMDKLEKAGYLPPAQVNDNSSTKQATEFDADLEALHNLNQAHVEDAEDDDL